MTARALLGASLAMHLVACGGTGEPTDASFPDVGDLLTHDAGRFEPSTPAEPAPPAAPHEPVYATLEPCPSGWRPVGDGTCEPFERGVVPSCGPDELPIPGEGCAPLGRPCAPWPADLPDSGVLYVQAGAPPGDGTRDRPFARIADAMRAAVPGATIALAPGRYEEQVLLDRAITLAGSCAAETRLAHADGTAILVRGSATLRDVWVESAGYGIEVLEGAALAIDGVAVEAALGLGVFVRGALSGRGLRVRGVLRPSGWETASALAVDGGVVELSRVALERTTCHALSVSGDARVVVEDATLAHVRPGGAFNAAVYANGGTLTLRRAVVEEGTTWGMLVTQGAVASLEDVVVRDTHASPDDTAGRGVEAAWDGVVRGTRVLVERNRDVGVAVVGGRIELSNAIVRDTAPQLSDGERGSGVMVVSGGHASLSATRVASCVWAGIYLSGASAQASDLVVEGARAAPRALEGFGILVHRGASLVLERARLVGNQWTGLVVDGEVLAHDLVVRGTRPAFNGLGGSGIAVGGGVLHASRVLAEGNADNAIKVMNGALVEVEDLTVDDTRAAGIWVTHGAPSSLTLRRARIERTVRAGIEVEQASVADLQDLRIRSVESDPVTGLFGNGVRVSGGSHVSVRRTLLEHTREVGLFALDVDSRIEAEDVQVRSTLERGCATRTEDPCPSIVSAGCGVAALGHGDVSLSRFVLEDNVLCGAMVATHGRVVLRDGVVAGHPIGVNVQVEGYDVSLLTDRVRYQENERNYDGSRIPLPDSTAPPLSP